MEQKTISRNCLHISGGRSEEFFHECQKGMMVAEVSSVWDWPDGCFVELGFDGSRQELSFFLHKDDALRFAQAILYYSGAAKVVD